MRQPTLETRHVFDYPRGPREAIKFLSWFFLGLMVSCAALPWLLPRDPARLEAMAAAIFFAVAVVVCLLWSSFFGRKIVVDSRGMTSVLPGGEEALFCWDEVTRLRERPYSGALEFHGPPGKKPLKVGYALSNLDEFLRIALAQMDWARLLDGAKTGPSGETLFLPAEFRLPKLSILLLVLVDLLLLFAFILFLRRAHELFQAGWRGSMCTALLALAALTVWLYLSLRLPLGLRVDSREIQVRRPLSRQRIPTGEIVAVRIERSPPSNNRCPRVALTARNGENIRLPNFPWGLLAPYRAVLTALGDLKGFGSRPSR